MHKISNVAEAEFDFNNKTINVKNIDTTTKKHQRQIPFLTDNFITIEKIKELKI
jgi:hypothetical protein